MDHFPVTKKSTQLKKKKGWKGILLSLFQKKKDLHISLPLKSFDSQFSAFVEWDYSFTLQLWITAVTI